MMDHYNKLRGKFVRSIIRFLKIAIFYLAFSQSVQANPFDTYVNENADGLGITAGEVTAINTLKSRNIDGLNNLSRSQKSVLERLSDITISSDINFGSYIKKKVENVVMIENYAAAASGLGKILEGTNLNLPADSEYQETFNRLGGLEFIEDALDAANERGTLGEYMEESFEQLSASVNVITSVAEVAGAKAKIIKTVFGSDLQNVIEDIKNADAHIKLGRDIYNEASAVAKEILKEGNGISSSEVHGILQRLATFLGSAELETLAGTTALVDQGKDFVRSLEELNDLIEAEALLSQVDPTVKNALKIAVTDKIYSLVDDSLKIARSVASSIDPTGKLSGVVGVANSSLDFIRKAHINANVHQIKRDQNNNAGINENLKLASGAMAAVALEIQADINKELQTEEPSGESGIVGNLCDRYDCDTPWGTTDQNDDGNQNENTAPIRNNNNDLNDQRSIELVDGQNPNNTIVSPNPTSTPTTNSSPAPASPTVQVEYGGFIAGKITGQASLFTRSVVIDGDSSNAPTSGQDTFTTNGLSPGITTSTSKGNFTFTEWGQWNGTGVTLDGNPVEQATVVFGRLTAPSEMPSSGTRNFGGASNNSQVGGVGFNGEQIGGTIGLNADFGTGQVSGQFDFTADGNSWVNGTIANTPIQGNRFNANGNNLNIAQGGEGILNGAFFGDNAQEVGGDWAIFNVPGAVSGADGVFRAK